MTKRKLLLYYCMYIFIVIAGMHFGVSAGCSAPANDFGGDAAATCRIAADDTDELQQPANQNRPCR